MKRFYILLLSLVLLLSLAACGGEEETASEEGEEIVETQPPVVETPEEEPVEVPEEPAEEPVEKPEEEPAEQPAETPTTNTGSGTTPSQPKIPQSDKAYLARINLAHCVVNIFSKDENGEYTVPVKAMICSTGYATPKAGKFYRLGNTWEWLRLKGNVYGHYVTQITGNILFHSVPYLRWGDPASLEYWEFDKLGVKASQGCIRLQVSDAIWIYNNAWNIVGVEFYSDEDPGPFGKPTAPKISDNELCRDWDPTDPNPENPWHDYVESGVESGIDPETGLPVEEVPTEGDESVTEETEGETTEGGDETTEEAPGEGTEEDPPDGTEGNGDGMPEDTPGDTTEGTPTDTPDETPGETTEETSTDTTETPADPPAAA